MSGLLSKICPSRQAENGTTEILAYLLRDSSCRLAFLSLLDKSMQSDNYKVDTQYHIENVGNPDLVLQDNDGQWIILIENKPWQTSSFTTKRQERDQMIRYHKWLNELNENEKCKNFQEKILCLLATERNKDRLEKEAKITPDRFVVITWEDVIAKLNAACPEDEVVQWLLSELNDYIVPRHALTDETRIRADWETIKNRIKEAKNCAGSYLSRYEVFQAQLSEGIDNYYGFYICDQTTPLTYFFGAHLPARRFLAEHDKPTLFVLQVKFADQTVDPKYKNKSEAARKPILEKCGFLHDPVPKGTRCEYVFPLTDSDGYNITSEKLAEALTRILKKTGDEFDHARILEKILEGMKKS